MSAPHPAGRVGRIWDTVVEMREIAQRLIDEKRQARNSAIGSRVVEVGMETEEAGG